MTQRFAISLTAMLSVAASLAISSNASAATYAQPTVSSFTPTTVAIGGVVTVNGSGFTGLNKAWIGYAHDAKVKVISDTQVQITVPADAEGGQIAVLNPDHAAFSFGDLTVSSATAATPVIKSFTPTSGAVGAIATVTGTGFKAVNSAWVGAARDAGVNVLSDTEAKVTIPKDAATGVLTLLNSAHSGSSTTKFTVTATTYVQPSISSFSPTSGAVGSIITLKGAGFTGLNSAWIGAAHDAVVKVVSDTQATVTVPKDAVAGLVVLLNPQHAVFTSSDFTVSTNLVSSTGTSTSSSSTGTSTSSGTTTSTSSGSTTTGSTSSSSGSTSTSSSGTTTTTSAGTGNSSLSVRVSGDHFIDANGNTLQMRGVNLSGLEFVAVQGWDASDPWGGVDPNFTAIKTWKSNTVRIPLNEASWLGYTCTDGTGATRDPDPGHNYQATVKAAVANATAAGLYVSLDLHWTAPGKFCPLAQNPMADADNSITFWTSIATTFKGYPNVMFELFNEPYLYWLTSGEVDWTVMMKGGTETAYVTGNGSAYTANYTWQVASMQAMLNAIRATGATNVVLVAGTSWAQDLSLWAANKPSDPLNQLAAVWHAYPDSGTVGDPLAAVPKWGTVAYTWTQSVLTAGYPVLITEFGDHDAAGTVGSPFVSNLLPWADAHGASYTGWTWDPWSDADNVLIKDASGTPTDGYGVYTKAHYLCVAAGSSNCP